MNTATRSADLRQILIERRRELQDDVQNRIRGGRIDQSHDVGDHVDTSDAHIQGDIEFALLQMRAQTLTRISEALVRLEAGQYGTVPFVRMRDHQTTTPSAAVCGALPGVRRKA